MDDDSRFADFVAERADALLRYGYVLSGNPHDAADLTQEALIRLHRAWSRVRRKSDPEGYARTTMARLHVSAWRLRRRERLVWDPPEDAHLDAPPSGAEQGLWRALEDLPRKQRAVLVLRYYEQLTDAEIARVLGVSRGTVRSHASLGLGRLRAAVPHPTTADRSAR
ncbi:SigE family RNA polymerase sigma factor [Planomonospora parontospora]|uniref:SigE family RNA polymerase sigma factor n=1 Tax=Planomonospora parontospora TaxID=58119 RepID=UPI001670857D|nr:SigE family RNA polymerase sigma factor [Planomonospora parontospora]GGL45493.1 DNA-directed RNA polymerase sigma-70 factor [Planomonospora parontospora subsp. antibiotica]GII18631.1 DNA-directed RNA polymerase sigma-70 factor [Planomonospora parontospora subsp. antibiotica]